MLETPPSRTVPSESERHSFRVLHTAAESVIVITRKRNKLNHAVLSVQWESLLSWLRQVFYNIVNNFILDLRIAGFLDFAQRPESTIT
jgi:hypothetical protein